MPGSVPTCNMAATRGFSSNNYVIKKVNKQVEAKIWNLGIKEQKSRKQGNS